MTIESILVATDLARQQDMAIERAWQLAHTHRATVKLMHMAPAGHGAAFGAGARRQQQDLEAQARGMDLVVLPHGRDRSTAAFFRGQPVLRLLRCCSCPVLVTRQIRSEHYRRILVAVDFSAGSDAIVQLAAELDPRADLEIFHGISILAETRLRDASGADLVVLGKRRACAWEDFFCGSIAHRVLSWGSSDVLLVPQDAAPASAPVARRRIGKGMTPASAPGAGRRPS
jgi:nucleotide-binding universal stress UspA family protein